MQHLLQAFLRKQNLMIVWLNRAMINLCQGFCYIKDIRVWIVIWIYYNNVATEITCLQKNMVALQNLAPPAPLRIQPPPDSKVPPQLLKSRPQSHIFFSPPPFARGMHSMVMLGHQTWLNVFVTSLVMNFPNFKLCLVILWTTNWKLLSSFLRFKVIYHQSRSNKSKRCLFTT